jgi:hypothetical protein
MGILSKIFGGAVAEPINAVGKIIDDCWDSDEELMDKQAILNKIAQRPALVQAEINKVEASHRNLFVAGWRPFIGWACGLGLVYDVVFRPIMNGYGYAFPAIDIATLKAILYALLGLGAYRTIEKFGHVTK